MRYFLTFLLGVLFFAYANSQDNQFLSWKINAKGIKSGKTESLEGGSKDLENCWKKLSEKLAVSIPEENVVVEMTFTNTNVVLVDTLESSKIKKFPKKHFEILSNCEVFNYDFPEWTSPFYNNAVIKAEIDFKNSSPEGKGCLRLEGRDENRDGYVCSLTKHFKNIYTSNSSVITSLKSGAKDTWIFFYAYGNGNPLDAVQLLVSEGSPQGLMENESIIGFYSYDIPLDFVGWKQFAIRYSDLKPTVPFFVNDNRKKFGEQGDAVLDPKELMGIQFTLVTKAPGAQASVCLDKLMILYNR